jgi:hypothetical protein
MLDFPIQVKKHQTIGFSMSDLCGGTFDHRIKKSMVFDIMKR